MVVTSKNQIAILVKFHSTLFDSDLLSSNFAFIVVTTRDHTHLVVVLIHLHAHERLETWSWASHTQRWHLPEISHRCCSPGGHKQQCYWDHTQHVRQSNWQSQACKAEPLPLNDTPKPQITFSNSTTLIINATYAKTKSLRSKDSLQSRNLYYNYMNI